MMSKCVVLEIENALDFETRLEVYLKQGYEISASSCNSRLYKAILINNEENIVNKDLYERLVKQDTPDDVVVDDEGYPTCPSCGVTVDEHDYYCHKCGQAFEWLQYYKEKMND